MFTGAYKLLTGLYMFSIAIISFTNCYITYVSIFVLMFYTCFRPHNQTHKLHVYEIRLGQHSARTQTLLQMFLIVICQIDWHSNGHAPIPPEIQLLIHVLSMLRRQFGEKFKQ